MSERHDAVEAPEVAARRSRDDVRADTDTLTHELLTVFERHAGEVDDDELAQVFFEIAEAIARNRCVSVGVKDTNIRAEGFDHTDAGIIQIAGSEVVVGAPQWVLCPECDNSAEHTDEVWPAAELAAMLTPEVGDG